MKTIYFRPIRNLLERSKLSTVMVLCFLFLNISFLTVIIIVSYNKFSEVTFSEISGARLELLNESTRLGFDFVKNMTDTAYSVVTNNDLTDMLTAPSETTFDIISRRRAISELIRRTLVLNESISSVELFTDRLQGVYPNPQDPMYPLSAIRNETWFTSLDKADAVWVPEQKVESSFPKPYFVISYVQRIFDKTGGTIGYLKIDMSHEAILRNFANFPMVLDGESIILDTKGNVILKMNETKPAADETMKKSNNDVWFQQLLDSAEDGYYVAQDGGESYLLLYSKPSTLQWRVIQAIPLKALLKNVYEAGKYIVLFAFLIAIIASIVIILVVRNMIHPLRILMSAMRRLKHGDFEARVESSFTEEYVHLSQGFNHMAEQLQELVNRVKAESKAKRDAEIGLLQAQIKPHFIYNTLDAIHWKAMGAEVREISQMVTLLAKMLRIGLSEGKMFIPLRDEIEHARCYVRIQQISKSSQFIYKENVPRHIRGYFVAKVIIQPFLENAVIHGMSHGMTENLQIEMEISEIETNDSTRLLEIRIKDNGQGFPAGWSFEGTQGIGILNVHRRITLYCGESYGVSCTNHPLGGAEVIVRLPVITHEQQLIHLLGGEPL